MTKQAKRIRPARALGAPLPPTIEDLIPQWTLRVEDECASGLLRGAYATRMLAVTAGAHKHAACARALREGDRLMPSESAVLRGRVSDRICHEIAKADRLFSRAEYCAQRRR